MKEVKQLWALYATNQEGVSGDTNVRFANKALAEEAVPIATAAYPQQSYHIGLNREYVYDNLEDWEADVKGVLY